MCDVLCAMFWICSYIAYSFAIYGDGTLVYKTEVRSEKAIVNRASVQNAGHDPSIWDYRNAYAHSDYRGMCKSISLLLNVIPKDIEYTDSMLYYINMFKEIYSNIEFNIVN